jgi:hypothetical protein
MAVAQENRQKIGRLTPLDDVLLRISDCVHPALGSTLAQDIISAGPHPAVPLA